MADKGAAVFFYSIPKVFPLHTGILQEYVDADKMANMEPPYIQSMPEVYAEN